MDAGQTTDQEGMWHSPNVAGPHTNEVENMWMRAKRRTKKECGTARTLLVGRRLVRYALENRSVNLDPDHDCYTATFFPPKDGLTVPRLHELTRDIVRANINLVFLEIAAKRHFKQNLCC